MKKLLPAPSKPATHLPFAIGIPALIWQTLFFYLPLLLLAVSSFLKVSESGKFQGLTLQNIALFLNPTYLRVIFASLALALSNTLLCFCVGFPLAYFLAFSKGKYKNLLLFLLIVPFWTNFLLHVYAWFYVLERHGFLNTLLIHLGIIDQPFHFLNSLFSIGVMMLYYYLPFMVLPIYASLENFKYNLIEASYDLGGSFFTTFRRIVLPLTSKGIRAGFFLVFIPSFGEFAIPELMGGDRKMFVGTVVSQYILGEGTTFLGAAFTLVSSVILLGSAAILYLILSKILHPELISKKQIVKEASTSLRRKEQRYG